MDVELILDEAHEGWWNMSADQYLLQRADGDGIGALRFYTWSEPTLSLGYFQEAAGRAGHRPSSEIAWVRRSTGGGAIVHHHDLTYSLTVADAFGRGESRPLYQTVHRAVRHALSRQGVTANRYGEAPSCGAQVSGSRVSGAHERRCVDPWLCFQRRTEEDLLVHGYKVVGSAQRRGRRAVLQHGSLLLAASPHAAELPGIADLTETRLDLDGFKECLVGELGNSFRFQRRIGGWMATEIEAIRTIADGRFGDSQWNHRK